MSQGEEYHERDFLINIDYVKFFYWCEDCLMFFEDRFIKLIRFCDFLKTASFVHQKYGFLTHSIVFDITNFHHRCVMNSDHCRSKK